MIKEDKINVELFFYLLELKKNLTEVFESCDTQFEMMMVNPEKFKHRISLVVKEMQNTSKEIETTNQKMVDILYNISISALDEIIKKYHSDINELLDIRSLKMSNTNR